MIETIDGPPLICFGRKQGRRHATRIVMRYVNVFMINVLTIGGYNYFLDVNGKVRDLMSWIRMAYFGGCNLSKFHKSDKQ